MLQLGCESWLLEVPLQNEQRGTPNKPKKRHKRHKKKPAPKDISSPEPQSHDTTAQPYYYTQEEIPLPPTPQTQHLNQSTGLPALTPGTTHKQPNPEPSQHPDAETQPKGGQLETIDKEREQQPWGIKQRDINQERTTEH